MKMIDYAVKTAQIQMTYGYKGKMAENEKN